MDTEIKNAIRAADREAQYDEKAKSLLGNKHILAHILVKTVDEFKGMKPTDVIPYIEGEPMIGVVPLDSGLTNIPKKMQNPRQRQEEEKKQKKGQRLVGFNSEQAVVNEGLVRFDIVFYVRMKDGLSQMIVNVEAQKDNPAGYVLLNRAVFYTSRLISSQKERDFINTNYQDIRRVYSIWICMNMSEDSLSYIHLTSEELLGSYHWKGGVDLINIVMIGLSKELPEQKEEYELHRLLGTLFSRDLPVEERLNLIETEYDIPVSDGMRRDVNDMCNLSQGIKEAAWEEGRLEGERTGRLEGERSANAELIFNMHRKGYHLEQIADVTEKDIDEIKAIIDEKESVLV